VATGNRYEPYQLRDPDGVPVVAVTAYFRDLLAAGRAESTVRSYGMDLLRWFRFLWSDSGVGWDRATRVEARDFCRWMQIGGKQPRPHRCASGVAPSSKPARGQSFSPSVRAHSETVSEVMAAQHLVERNLYMKNEIEIGGVAHMAGTCRFGANPKTSVLDTNCKAHELDNLYVVDTSFFPSIGAVNPALTAMANALRVGDHLLERL